MDTCAAILSYASGFALMRSDLGAAEMLATSLAVNLALGPLTAIIAARRGRNRIVWAALGLSLGMWALAAVLLIGSSSPRPDDPPSSHFPTSHAA